MVYQRGNATYFELVCVPRPNLQILNVMASNRFENLMRRTMIWNSNSMFFLQEFGLIKTSAISRTPVCPHHPRAYIKSAIEYCEKKGNERLVRNLTCIYYKIPKHRFEINLKSIIRYTANKESMPMIGKFHGFSTPTSKFSKRFIQE